MFVICNLWFGIYLYRKLRNAFVIQGIGCFYHIYYIFAKKVPRLGRGTYISAISLFP